jgi:hypothetical protein
MFGGVFPHAKYLRILESIQKAKYLTYRKKSSINFDVNLRTTVAGTVEEFLIDTARYR